MALVSISGAAGILSQFERQRKLMDSLANPFPVQRWMEQQQRQRKLLEDPLGIRARDKALRQMLRPTVLEQFARQQRLLDELIKGPAFLGSLGGLTGVVSSTVSERAELFRDELAAEAVAEEVKEGNDPLPRLVADREAILTCLARIRESAIVAVLLDVPIPDLVLALVIAAVVMGEVADDILREREADIAV